MADIKIFDSIELTRVLAKSDDFLNHHEPMKNIYEKVKQNDGIKAYMEAEAKKAAES